MRLSDEQIRQGLLHADKDVRSACLRYFAESFSQNTAVMPAVIGALGRYGRVTAFEHTFPIADLPQTEETIRWVVGELQSQAGRTEQERHYLRHLSQLLCNADPHLLRPHEQAILASPGFDRDCARPLGNRLKLLSWDAEALWRELESICEAGKDKGYIRDLRYDEGEQVVEALARDGERHAGRMMALLAVRVEGYENNPMKWLEPLMVRLAGELRHQPAISLIVRKLHQDAEVTSEECLTALAKIGTDGAVQALRDAYPGASWHFRLYATGALGRIHTDRAVRACIGLLEKEEDLDLQNWLAQALVEQFSSEGNEVARQVLLGDPDLFDLQCALVPACTMMGQDFPELEDWRQEVEEKMRPRPLRQRPAPAPAPAPVPPRTPPATAKREVGRNDPCPCGSGKKFKKCCLNKRGSF
jgi:hypothetical protein